MRRNGTRLIIHDSIFNNRDCSSLGNVFYITKSIKRFAIGTWHVYFLSCLLEFLRKPRTLMNTKERERKRAYKVILEIDEKINWISCGMNDQWAWRMSNYNRQRIETKNGDRKDIRSSKPNEKRAEVRVRERPRYGIVIIPLESNTDEIPKQPAYKWLRPRGCPQLPAQPFWSTTTISCYAATHTPACAPEHTPRYEESAAGEDTFVTSSP